MAWMAVSDRQREVGALDVAEGLLAGQRGVRGILRPAKDRAVLSSELDVHDHRAVRRGVGLLHPLVQREADQDLTGLPQPHRASKGTRARCLTSRKFTPPWVNLRSAPTRAEHREEALRPRRSA